MLVLAIQVVAGHPQSTLYSLLLVGGYLVYAGIVRRGLVAPSLSRTSTGLWCLLLGLGLVGLSAYQLFPTLRLVAEVSRSEGLSYLVAARNSLSAEHLLTLLFPDAMSQLPPDEGDSVRGAYWERSSYVGILVTVAAPFAFTVQSRRPLAVYLVFAALLALGMAFGRNLPFFELHYLLFPGLGRRPG